MQELEAFYDEHVDKVYKYFYINCLNRHIAEDLTSQTFVKFIDKVKSQEIDDDKKYLYGVMRNVWMDYLRAKYNEKLVSIDQIEDFEAHAEQVVSSFQSKDMKQRAKQFIHKLPPKQRQVIHMRLIEEKTLKDIASELGKNMSYVKTTQQRAIKRLKVMLENPEFEGGLL